MQCAALMAVMFARSWREPRGIRYFFLLFFFCFMMHLDIPLLKLNIDLYRSRIYMTSITEFAATATAAAAAAAVAIAAAAIGRPPAAN